MKKTITMRYIPVSIGALIALVALVTACKEPASSRPPNVIIIYVDDLGYGDLGAYGGTLVSTPHLDKLASEGLLFTDAHASSATCTPSRYSLLTGNYAFRIKAGILPGDAPLLIRPGTPNLASVFKNAGYATAVIGKWHLGLGDGQVNWNEEIKPGPLEIGFDHCFIIPATGDRVPIAYLEDYRIAGLEPNDSLFISFTDNPSAGNPFGGPTGLSHPELLKQPADTQHSGSIINGVSRIGFQTGGKAAEWIDEEFPEVFLGKAVDFIDKNHEKPFFLYFNFHEIHVPRIPGKAFAGKSALGPRGDAIMQMDWVTGQLVANLERLGIAENTLVIFSSDNGPVLNDGYEDLADSLNALHKPAGPFRGGKYSIYEAGTRMPTIAWWPGTIAPGKSDALWGQVDLLASLAAIAGLALPPSAGMDSQDMSAVILGKEKQGREILLEEASTFGLRQGQWKYILPAEGAEWIEKQKKIEGGIWPEPQLYDLANDPGEQNNLAETFPDKVAELDSILMGILESQPSP